MRVAIWKFFHFYNIINRRFLFDLYYDIVIQWQRFNYIFARRHLPRYECRRQCRAPFGKWEVSIPSKTDTLCRASNKHRRQTRYYEREWICKKAEFTLRKVIKFFFLLSSGYDDMRNNNIMISFINVSDM